MPRKRNKKRWCGRATGRPRPAIGPANEGRAVKPPGPPLWHDLVAMRAYIGLGGNLKQPQQHVLDAQREIASLAGVEALAFSRLYRSAPMGPKDQPDYINAVMAIETPLTPLELLDRLQAIETAHGRVRQGERWGPRTLDLDLLVYGDTENQSERLTVPHPGIALRRFVLMPLHDVEPHLKIPGLGSLESLLAACPLDGLAVILDVEGG